MVHVIVIVHIITKIIDFKEFRQVCCQVVNIECLKYKVSKLQCLFREIDLLCCTFMALSI